MAVVKKDAPDQTIGFFDDNSSIKYIHAVLGKKAQVKSHHILLMPLEYYNVKIWPDNKFLDGPSISGVLRDSDTSYNVNLENISMAGFKYNNDKKILSDTDASKEGRWGKEFNEWKNTYNGSNWKTYKGAVVSDYTIPSLDNKSFKII